MSADSARRPAEVFAVGDAVEYVEALTGTVALRGTITEFRDSEIVVVPPADTAGGAREWRVTGADLRPDAGRLVVVRRRVVALYEQARACVTPGFRDQLDWARALDPAKVTEREFLAEVLFVALNSGMRGAVVRGLWPLVTACFDEFADTAAVAARGDAMVTAACAHFNSPGKLRSVVGAAKRVVAAGGWTAFRETLLATPGAAIDGIPYIGKVTRWHLLRNLGANVAKPDRHLVRFAQAHGWGTNVQAMCEAIAAATGERVGVVDLVLWRHAEQGCTCTDRVGSEPR